MNRPSFSNDLKREKALRRFATREGQVHGLALSARVVDIVADLRAAVRPMRLSGWKSRSSVPSTAPGAVAVDVAERDDADSEFITVAQGKAARAVGDLRGSPDHGAVLTDHGRSVDRGAGCGPAHRVFARMARLFR
jgi:hypothetical protein